MKRVIVPRILLCLCVVLSASGCTYMQHRGSDALDMFNVGVTVSKEPGFSLYAGVLSVVLTLGYSNVDGTLYGLADGNAGAVRMRQNAGGVILWGYEQFGYEQFDAADEDSPEPWKVGLIGVIEGPGPRDGQVVNCPKLLHLGWVGLTLNCKFGEMADFLLGWTTLDLMGDDETQAAG